MGQATRTTKLSLDLGERTHGGVNTTKRAYLEATVAILDQARAFYVDFFLAHADKFSERVSFYSEEHQEMRERAISANELLTWTEFHTIATKDHPHPWPTWNFSQAFPDMPFLYRRSVIKDAIGKARSYLSNLSNWQKTRKKKDKPGVPGASNHPTLYEGAFSLELDGLDQRETFVRLKVYTGACWTWSNYPVLYSRYFEQRRTEVEWEQQSPKLVLRPKFVELHFPHTKEVRAKKVKESKQDPSLVTVAVDLNVKNLAVITIRQHGTTLETVFVTDHGLDQHRYQHLKRISKKQWLSGSPITGEHSNQQLWRHVRCMNTDAAQKTARAVANVCAKYPGCVLLFERLRKINQYSREKAFAEGVVTVEVNPHGTSQYCSRCGAKGERFSFRGGKRIKEKWGKLFWCSQCRYEVNADFNASVNVHHSFFQQFHWKTRPKRSG